MEDVKNLLFKSLSIPNQSKSNSKKRKKRKQSFFNFTKITNSLTKGRSRVELFVFGLLISSVGLFVHLFIKAGLLDLLFQYFGISSIYLVSSLFLLSSWFIVCPHASFKRFKLNLLAIIASTLLMSWVCLIVVKDVGYSGLVGFYTFYPLVKLSDNELWLKLISAISSILFTGLQYNLYLLFSDFDYIDRGKKPESLKQAPPESVIEVPAVNPVVNDDPFVELISGLGFNGVELIEKNKSGPILENYLLRLPSGAKVNKLQQELGNISNNLGVSNIYLETVVPDMPRCVRFFMPKSKSDMQPVKYEKLDKDYGDAKLPMVLGKSTGGDKVHFDLQEVKHVLVAGQTGAGKSKLVEAMMISLLETTPASELDMIVIDPKQVEMTMFESAPHLRGSIISDPKEAEDTLSELCEEMDNRYTLMRSRAVERSQSIKNIDAYNKSMSREGGEKMKKLLIVIDEIADLMMHFAVDAKQIETFITRIAQKGRAAGMHLVLATQRPTVDVITGLIKANIPCRIALKVASQIDSRVIIDTTGAEKLLGYGDMLISHSMFGSEPYRVHGCYIEDENLEGIISNLR